MLAESSAGSDGKPAKHQSNDTAEQMARNKERQEKLEIQKKQLIEKMDDCKKKIERKTVSTIEPERYEDKISAKTKGKK